MSTIQETLKRGSTLLKDLPQPVLEARVLLQKASGLSEETIYAWPQRELTRRQERQFYKLISRRRSGIPLPYLTGEREFWSIPFRMSLGVFIPRPETELIVEKVLALSSGGKGKGRAVGRWAGKAAGEEAGRVAGEPVGEAAGAKAMAGEKEGKTAIVAGARKEAAEIIVDIGTGCGNIAISLAKEMPQAQVFATDTSLKALKVARLNAELQEAARIHFVRGSLYSPLKKLDLMKKCDFIVSNPPYVSESEWENLPAQIRNHEPRRAVVAGETGLEFIQRLIHGAPAFLKPGGYLLFEIGEGQRDEVLSLFDSGWKSVECFPDLSRIPRLIAARKK